MTKDYFYFDGKNYEVLSQDSVDFDSLDKKNPEELFRLELENTDYNFAINRYFLKSYKSLFEILEFSNGDYPSIFARRLITP